MSSIVASSETQNGQAKILSSALIYSSSTRSLKPSMEEVELVAHGVGEVGNVIICEVLSVGAHKKIEDLSGEFVAIKRGSLIVAVLGNRYSTTSMYGGLRESAIELPNTEPVYLLSAGGVIGDYSISPSYRGNPTTLRILGFASHKGELLKLSPQFKDTQLRISCPLILIVGTSAGAGKTKFAAKLTQILSHDLGRRVAVAKLTGAGNLDDLVNLKQAGAKYTFDFASAGLVTTYGVSEELVVEVAKGVLNHLGEKQPDVIIAELGGDILGANVPAILTDPEIRRKARAMILAPSDVLAAYGALTYMRDAGFPTDKVYVAQPLRNPAASQERAWNIVDRHLYDCENAQDLGRLIEETLGWGGKKEELVSQAEEQAKRDAILIH